MYKVKLQNFEGPLDLLLFFVRKDELDIYDIPIAHITRSYLEYLNLMQELNLDIAAEFILMAATLMRIKVKSMLPRDPGEEEEEEALDPREELTRRLIEYRQFKDASKSLAELDEYWRSVYRRSYFNFDLIPQHTDEPMGLKDITFFDLLAAYKKALAKKPKISYHNIERLNVTIEEQQEYIFKFFGEHKCYLFTDLCASMSKIEIVVTFLAMLDLIKRGEIAVKQATIFDDIWVYKPEAYVEDEMEAAEHAEEIRIEAEEHAATERTFGGDKLGIPEDYSQHEISSVARGAALDAIDEPSSGEAMADWEEMENTELDDTLYASGDADLSVVPGIDPENIQIANENVSGKGSVYSTDEAIAPEITQEDSTIAMPGDAESAGSRKDDHVHGGEIRFVDGENESESTDNLSRNAVAPGDSTVMAADDSADERESTPTSDHRHPAQSSLSKIDFATVIVDIPYERDDEQVSEPLLKEAKDDNRVLQSEEAHDGSAVLEASSVVDAEHNTDPFETLDGQPVDIRTPSVETSILTEDLSKRRPSEEPMENVARSELSAMKKLPTTLSSTASTLNAGDRTIEDSNSISETTGDLLKTNGPLSKDTTPVGAIQGNQESTIKKLFKKIVTLVKRLFSSR